MGTTEARGAKYPVAKNSFGQFSQIYILVSNNTLSILELKSMQVL